MNEIFVVILVTMLQLGAPLGSTESAPAMMPSATRPASGPIERPLDWATDYGAAVERARQAGVPILVRAGAVWCGWCKELEKELAKPQVQAELRRWALIYVDVDRVPQEARLLAFGPVPALRVLSPSGRLVDSHDGYLQAEELIEWLSNRYTSAAAPEGVATSGSDSSETAEDLVAELVRDLDRRDPAVREAAIRRLMLVPEQSAQPLVEALDVGNLATRLGAMEVLREWGGPIDGLDPWRPESVSAEVLQTLRQWAAKPQNIAGGKPTELTPGQWESVRRDLARLLQEDVSTAEADAIRERLARYGTLPLPEVYEAMRRAATDQARERLTCLRYRLVASDELVFSWPGGLERLAALDVGTRHAAADELAARCGAADEPLLLELFSDPDGLVREIALRGLHKVAGAQASGALVHLLNDPEPNVRAAVLKQMAESPSARIVTAVSEYVGREPDADLVVHAIRVLRSARNKAAAECLSGLLTHANWQVRAEAAEALGEILVVGDDLTAKDRRDTYKSLLVALEDSDSFVVSVAVKSLGYSDLPEAADALARAADRHPDLAADVLKLLVESSEYRNRAIPHLRRFCGHERASVRAVAIAALCQSVPHNVEREMLAALGDSSARVRIAAAAALLQLMEAQRPRPDEDASVHIQAGGVSESFFGALFRGFRRGSRIATSQPPGTQPPGTQPSGTQSAGTQPAGSWPASAPAVQAAGRDEEIHAAGHAESSKQDRWLEGFHAGQKRPKWMGATVPPLQAMLAGESSEEQLAAAVNLIGFGHDKSALPVLLATLEQRPELAGTAAGALPWLTWDKRIELFEVLHPLANNPAVVAIIADRMAAWPDPRAADPLWRLLDDSQMSPQSAASVLDALRQIYFGDYKYFAYSAPAERRQQAIHDTSLRAASGSALQRAAALALVLSVSLADADRQAEQVLNDPDAPASLRQDALRVRLLSQSRSGAQKLVAEALKGTDDGLRVVALRFLAEGPESMSPLQSGTFHLFYQNPAVERHDVFHAGTVIRVKAPVQLEPDVLRPLLDSPDPRTAALAGYVLATLQEADGLEPLVYYWREQARDNYTIRRLVYRAVAALNDDSQTPLLEEIYRTYGRNDYWLRDFYWTIRSMSGINVLKLRKQIRDEVGMDALR